MGASEVSNTTRWQINMLLQRWKWRDHLKNHILQFELVQPCSPNQERILKGFKTSNSIISGWWYSFHYFLVHLLIAAATFFIRYFHKLKKGGGIGTSQIPLTNIDCKANWLKFINQWCDKDHPKTWRVYPKPFPLASSATPVVGHPALLA